MVSVPHWTRDGYEFQEETGFSVRTLARRIAALVRRATGRTQSAPPAPKSLVYALCEEYRQLDLWTAYHTFRLDPHARNWRRLRRRNVPWQAGQTVENLLHRLHPMQEKKRTPDANTVGLALVTVPVSSKKKR